MSNPSKGEGIYEVLRHTAEKCEAMSSWFIIHSMGGGTGSGLGTNVLSVLADEFPDIERLVTPGKRLNIGDKNEVFSNIFIER